MSVDIFRKIMQALEVDANSLLGEGVPETEENSRFQDICHRISHLRQCEQKVVLQTMETLVEGMHRCR